jgi:hypothetical protein
MLAAISCGRNYVRPLVLQRALPATARLVEEVSSRRNGLTEISVAEPQLTPAAFELAWTPARWLFH